MIGHGYFISDYDSYVYHKKLSDGYFFYMFMYVGDILIVAKNLIEINKLKPQFNGKFEMKDLGAGKKNLGMEIHKDLKAS
jgi:hypothetical protein